ncbi:MAG: hypothetical protein F4X58_10620 [Chloroflexi bacterium]|nr:hypothetical protein [Chloroflexota bacterium]MYC02360.1 hypothetical protein [Chloroflexota bacterium]
MTNPFHLRANIDRLWRRSGDHNPGYVRVAALDAIVRELYAPTDRARANQQLYLTTDPFDVARHKLRDLYDRPGPLLPRLPPGEAGPALDAGGGGEGLPEEEEQPEENDDPL